MSTKCYNIRFSWYYPINPHKYFKENNITYSHAFPFSIADNTLYMNCFPIPDKLPEGFTLIETTVEDNETFLEGIGRPVKEINQ